MEVTGKNREEGEAQLKSQGMGADFPKAQEKFLIYTQQKSFMACELYLNKTIKTFFFQGIRLSINGQ